MRINYDINKFLEIQKSITINKKSNNKKSLLPDHKTFKEILEKAEKGNEMAAVQIFEWTKCEPTNNTEKQIINKANFALKSFFQTVIK